MALRLDFSPLPLSLPSSSCFGANLSSCPRLKAKILISRSSARSYKQAVHGTFRLPVISAALPPLDLTEDNVRQVLLDARSEFPQIFDASVGMTGEVGLAELDGPFVRISMKGRFWHKRSTVLARISNYLKIRIPEILEVDIEDEKQLDDSPANF